MHEEPVQHWDHEQRQHGGKGQSPDDAGRHGSPQQRFPRQPERQRKQSRDRGTGGHQNGDHPSARGVQRGVQSGHTDGAAGVAERYGEATQIRAFDGNPGRVTEMDALVAYLQIPGQLTDVATRIETAAIDADEEAAQ